MNELINRTSISSSKWRLLTSVSAMTLLAAFPRTAAAGDDRATVWIEVGTQLERLTDGQQSYAPPFVTSLLENPFTPPSKVQTSPRYSFGEEGKLSFVPSGSDWVFSASVRYGRANSSGNVHEQTKPATPNVIISNSRNNLYLQFPVNVLAERFATTASQTHSSSLVLDFLAGKDVGLGAFGSHGSSTINAGIRFAQFVTQSVVRIDSDPDFSVAYLHYTFGYYHSQFPRQQWDLYSGKMTASRSFNGVGPSLTWEANATLAGNQETSALTLDWGLNGALLFGRQKMAAHHETMAHHGSHIGSQALPTRYPTVIHNTARSRSAVVPNIGGFAGFSLRFSNAKVSLGYRVDAFFGAMDGGIDARKSYGRDFYGPFATISIGLGG